MTQSKLHRRCDVFELRDQPLISRRRAAVRVLKGLLLAVVVDGATVLLGTIV
jgi:hypothetical protein